MTIDVSDEQSLPIDTNALESLARHVLDQHGLPDETAVGIMLVDKAAMAVLNAEHMGASGPTDVLAFPIEDPRAGSVGPPVLGDVVLCPAVAADQAPGLGRTEAGELQVLLVHGLLHLLGMDHANPDDREEMFGLTDQLLSSHVAPS